MVKSANQLIGGAGNIFLLSFHRSHPYRFLTYTIQGSSTSNLVLAGILSGWQAGICPDLPGTNFSYRPLSDYHSTTWDARGVGRTRSTAPVPWAIADHASDCVALIDTYCTPPVFLIGMSMGSCIAQEISLTRLELVTAALLTGAYARKSGFIEEWETSEISLRRSGTQLPEDFAIAHDALLMYPAEVLGDDELWARVKPIVSRDYGKRDSKALAEQWQACLEYDSLDRLPDCKVPLHVIAFSEDVQTSPQRGRLLADAAHEGYFHLLEGLGHCSAFGHRSDLVNDCLLGVLQQYQ